MSYLVSSVDKYFLLREFLSLPGHCWEAVGLGRWNQAPSSCWATRVRCNLCVSLFSKVGQKESEKQLWKWGLMTLQVTLIKELWTSLTLFSLSFLVLWINCTRFSRWNTSPEVKQKPSDKCKSASGEKLSPGPPACSPLCSLVSLHPSGLSCTSTAFERIIFSVPVLGKYSDSEGNSD